MGITELLLLILELELTAIRRGRVGLVFMKLQLRAKGADNELAAAIYPAVGKCNNVGFVVFIFTFGLFIVLTNDGGTLQFGM